MSSPNERERTSWPAGPFQPKNFGKPCVRGLRMPVASILAYLSGGMSIDDLLKQWPELEREDVYQALGFAATLMEESVDPSEHR